MTGKELYELSSRGYKHDPWEQLPKTLKVYYEQCASARRRDNHEEQGSPIHNGESACCGGCSGHCC